MGGIIGLNYFSARSNERMVLTDCLTEWEKGRKEGQPACFPRLFFSAGSIAKAEKDKNWGPALPVAARGACPALVGPLRCSDREQWGMTH